MSSDPELGEGGTDPALGEHGTDLALGEHGTGPGPVEKPGIPIILYLIAGVPILTVFGLAVAFGNLPVLLVLILGGLLGGGVGAVRAHLRNKQGSPGPSTRTRSSAAGAVVGLLVAVGMTGVVFVVGAIGLVVILIMALQSWR